MNTYRQAALVVVNLDRNAADALLDRLPPTQAQAVRDEILLLEELSDSETHQAIDSFLSSSASPSPADCETEVSSSSNDAIPCPKETFVGSSTVNELLQNEDTKIAEVLRHERAAIVAAMLRCLPQSRAANLLRLLPTNFRVRVFAQLNSCQSAPEKLVDVVADRICEQLASVLDVTDQVDALLGIFKELPADEQKEMLVSLESEDPNLARKLLSVARGIVGDLTLQDCYC